METMRRASSWCAAAVLLVALGCARDRPVRAEDPPTAEEIDSLPLRVDLGVEIGMFAEGRAWTMHLEGTGMAAVLLYPGGPADGTRGSREVRALALDFDDLQAFRRVLARERFFELPPVLGRPADDLSPSWVEVRLGSRAHRVEMLYVSMREMEAGSNGVLGTPDDVARARRVFDALAGHLPGDWAAVRSPAWNRHLEERGR